MSIFAKTNFNSLPFRNFCVNLIETINHTKFDIQIIRLVKMVQCIAFNWFSSSSLKNQIILFILINSFLVRMVEKSNFPWLVVSIQIFLLKKNIH